MNKSWKTSLVTVLASKQAVRFNCPFNIIGKWQLETLEDNFAFWTCVVWKAVCVLFALKLTDATMQLFVLKQTTPEA